MKITVSKVFRDLVYPLSDEEFHLLEQNILEQGVRDPLTVWQNGKHVLIDGHHRKKVIDKFKIKNYRVNKLKFKNRDEVVKWILDNQLGRRNATAEAVSYLRGLRYKLEKKTHGGDRKSIPQNAHLKSTSELLAKRFKVNKSTIQRDERFADALTLLCSKLDKKDQQPTKNRILSRQIKLSKKDIIDISILPKLQIKAVLSGKKFIWQAKSDYNLQKKNNKLRNTHIKTSEFKFYVGDCVAVTKKHIKSSTVDLILTDPPYVDMKCYEKLGQVAKRILKPSGFCLCYCGALYLHEVLNIMSQYLDYYWQIMLWNKGSCGTNFNTQTFHGRKVHIYYKPILVFQKPPRQRPKEYFPDVIEGSGIEKDHHEWQQGKEEIYGVIDKFSPIGGQVVDPFCGSGTVAAACRAQTRRCTSIDVSGKHVKTAKNRLYSKP